LLWCVHVFATPNHFAPHAVVRIAELLCNHFEFFIRVCAHWIAELAHNANPGPIKNVPLPVNNVQHFQPAQDREKVLMPKVDLAF
jgi:hypothetical protein